MHPLMFNKHIEALIGVVNDLILSTIYAEQLPNQRERDLAMRMSRTLNIRDSFPRSIAMLSAMIAGSVVIGWCALAAEAGVDPLVIVSVTIVAISMAVDGYLRWLSIFLADNSRHLQDLVGELPDGRGAEIERIVRATVNPGGNNVTAQ